MEEAVAETEASLTRKNKSAGQCAYEAAAEFLFGPSFQPWDKLDLDDQEAWSHGAVAAWKKITEANSSKRFLT